MSEINVGKFGKNSGVNLNNFKAGLKEQDLKSDAQKSIFKAVDKDKNGILDEKELTEFKNGLDANGDNVISNREANKFLKLNGLDKKDKQELLQLLQNFNMSTKDVEEVSVTEKDGQKLVSVKYNDGKIETIKPDRSEEVVTTDENGTTTTQLLNSDKVLTSQTTVDKDGNKTDTEFESDGTTKSKETVLTSEGGLSTVVFEEGKPKSKEVKQGTTTENYHYDESGKELLDTRVENEGIEAKERHSTFTYNDDGTVTENVTFHNGSAVRQLNEDGKTPINEEITEDGKVTKRTYDYESQPPHYVDEITDGNNTSQTVRTLDGKALAQQKTVDGKVYNIEYDGEGNTKGIIVQNGESVEMIAKRFGCTPQEIRDLNQDLLKRNQFLVGAEIRVPGELEAGDKRLQGRKSAAEAKAEYARDAEIRRQKEEAAKQEREYYKKLGVKDFNDKGKKVKADGWGNKEFEVIGDVGYGRQLVKLDGKLYTRSHDSKILREDYLQAHKAYVNKPQNQRNNTVSGINDVTYVKDNDGKVWYFNEKTGKAIIRDNYTQIVRQESAFVADQLHTAAKGMGTNEEHLEQGVKNIY